MSNDVIQAQYEQLDNIANRFGQAAENNAALAQQVAKAAQTLQNGGWEGKGATAFFSEMETTISPALKRFIHALEEAQTVTLEIKQIIQQAEEKASAPFGGGGGNGTGTSGTSDGLLFPPGLFPPGVGPSPGQPGTSPTITPVPQPSSNGGSIWDHFRNKGDIWSYDGKGKKGKFGPGIKATFGTEESSLWGSPTGDGVSAVGGYGEVGLKASLDDGVIIGGGGEFYTVKGQWDTALVGDKEYGVTAGAGFKGPSAEAFGGFRFDRKDQSVGLGVGVNVASVEGSVGGNVAGVNVSAIGEVGLKAELGITIGRKTEIKLPFISFGLKFGGGVD
jgi:WXG100 family type VII secretion target